MLFWYWINLLYGKHIMLESYDVNFNSFVFKTLNRWQIFYCSQKPPVAPSHWALCWPPQEQVSFGLENYFCGFGPDHFLRWICRQFIFLLSYGPVVSNYAVKYPSKWCPHILQLYLAKEMLCLMPTDRLSNWDVVSSWLPKTLCRKCWLTGITLCTLCYELSLPLSIMISRPKSVTSH